MPEHAGECWVASQAASAPTCWPLNVSDPEPSRRVEWTRTGSEQSLPASIGGGRSLYRCIGGLAGSFRHEEHRFHLSPPIGVLHELVEVQGPARGVEQGPRCEGGSMRHIPLICPRLDLKVRD